MGLAVDVEHTCQHSTQSCYSSRYNSGMLAMVCVLDDDTIDGVVTFHNGDTHDNFCDSTMQCCIPSVHLLSVLLYSWNSTCNLEEIGHIWPAFILVGKGSGPCGRDFISGAYLIRMLPNRNLQTPSFSMCLGRVVFGTCTW
jgi:hypothetical protein